MSVQKPDNASVATEADASARGEASAQLSRGEPPLTVDELRKLNALVDVLYRVCDLCAEHGWPKDGPVYPWLEQQLSLLDRYRVANAEHER